ncbi:MAG: type II toxin-antitoxin system RelB/DinJ family antitoxin [Roseovarius sp.]|jgi:DNA-damage-inducible protein J
MFNDAIVRARVNEEIKEEATIVLSEIGLTLSDAFRMLIIRIAREKALPFEPLVPNAKTIEAIKAARRGNLITAGSLDNLLTELNAND